MSYYYGHNSYNDYSQGAAYYGGQASSSGYSYGSGGQSGSSTSYGGGSGQAYYKPPPKSRYNTQPSPFIHNRNFEAKGWEYTGCNATSKVEFYEKPDGTKLDYYPTTGTLKTSLAHPKQGKTQMFRRGLSEWEYERVAANPRAHTGKGYKTKKYAPY